MKVEIFTSPIQGRGVRALVPIKKGECILRMTGRKVSGRTVDRLIATRKLRRDDPFELSEDEYLILDALPVCFNHSCAPNACLARKTNLVASKNIRAGEEITYDYSLTVGSSNGGWKMRCRCGTRGCRAVIGNIDTLVLS